MFFLGLIWRRRVGVGSDVEKQEDLSTLLYFSYSKSAFPRLPLPCLKTFCVAARCRKGGEAKACPLIGETSKANTCDRSPMTIQRGEQTNRNTEKKHTTRNTDNQVYRKNIQTDSHINRQPHNKQGLPPNWSDIQSKHM